MASNFRSPIRLRGDNRLVFPLLEHLDPFEYRPLEALSLPVPTSHLLTQSALVHSFGLVFFERIDLLLGIAFRISPADSLCGFVAMDAVDVILHVCTPYEYV